MHIINSDHSAVELQVAVQAEADLVILPNLILLSGQFSKICILWSTLWNFS